jgi:two-component system nitrogen regulation response regulator GlnG
VRVIAATHQDLEARVRAGQFREDLFHRLNVIRLKLPPLRERQEDIPLLAKHFLHKSAQDLKVETKVLSPAAMEVLVRLPFPGNVRQLENLCHWMTVMAPSQVVQAEDLPSELRSPVSLGGASIDSKQVSLRNGTSEASEASEAFVGTAGGSVRSMGQAASGQESIANGHHVCWQDMLRDEVSRALSSESPIPDEGRMNSWSKEFEAAVLGIALRHTRGRRLEAAQLLGIGRNTMTRKIAELNLERDI